MIAPNIVLGIDPSLNSTGWAVVSLEGGVYRVIDCGSVVSEVGGDVVAKIGNIAKKIQDVIAKYGVKVMSIEETFVNKNASTSLKLGMVRGGCMAIGAMLGTQVFEYSAREVKMMITGKGSAGKDQLAFMLKHIISKEFMFKNSDESDAVCVALAHFFRSKIDLVV